jgi:hypothetical protein
VDPEIFVANPAGIRKTSVPIGANLRILKNNVPDPDPHVFGPPGSGSGSFYHHAKIVRKSLIPSIS